jgi:hypothetical protein
MGYQNQNLALMKRFPIEEHVTFELRADCFNLWNSHSFSYSGRLGASQFNTTLSSAQFGMWGGSVSGPRNTTMSAKLTF